MDYKTILVHLDHPDRALSVVKVAMRIAERFDSVVNGLYVVPSLEVLGSLASGGAGPEFVRRHRSGLIEQSEECERIFNSVLAGAHNHSHWQLVESQLDRVSNEVLRHVRTSDLTVVSQTPKEEDILFVSETPERIVLSGGRPVVVVPLGYQAGDRFGQRVLVAWDGSKEASRALSDSLPLLVNAEDVKAVWVVDGDAEPTSVADMKRRFDGWMKQHGVAGSLQIVEAEDHDVSSVIDRHLQDSEGDTLVAGGYGDSRLKEFLTGGVTRTLLEQCRVPLFMTS